MSNGPLWPQTQTQTQTPHSTAPAIDTAFNFNETRSGLREFNDLGYVFGVVFNEYEFNYGVNNIFDNDIDLFILLIFIFILCDVILLMMSSHKYSTITTTTTTTNISNRQGLDPKLKMSHKNYQHDTVPPLQYTSHKGSESQTQTQTQSQTQSQSQSQQSTAKKSKSKKTKPSKRQQLSMEKHSARMRKSKSHKSRQAKRLFAKSLHQRQLRQQHQQSQQQQQPMFPNDSERYSQSQSHSHSHSQRQGGHLPAPPAGHDEPTYDELQQKLQALKQQLAQQGVVSFTQEQIQQIQNATTVNELLTGELWQKLNVPALSAKITETLNNPNTTRLRLVQFGYNTAIVSGNNVKLANRERKMGISIVNNSIKDGENTMKEFVQDMYPQLEEDKIERKQHAIVEQISDLKKDYFQHPEKYQEIKEKNPLLIKIYELSIKRKKTPTLNEWRKKVKYYLKHTKLTTEKHSSKIQDLIDDFDEFETTDKEEKLLKKLKKLRTQLEVES